MSYNTKISKNKEEISKEKNINLKSTETVNMPVKTKEFDTKTSIIPVETTYISKPLFSTTQFYEKTITDPIISTEIQKTTGVILSDNEIITKNIDTRKIPDNNLENDFNTTNEIKNEITKQINNNNLTTEQIYKINNRERFNKKSYNNKVYENDFENYLRKF